MIKRIIGFLGAGLLAIVGSGLLIAYVRSAEERVQEGESLVEVLVATGEIQRGTSSDDLARLVSTQRVPSKVLVNGAMTELADLEGLVPEVNLLPGEQISRDRFVEPTSVNVFARSQAAPPGLLEVTFSLDPERIVGGSVAPGELVAVVASFDPFNIGAVALPENFDPSLTRDQLDELEKIYLIDNKLLSGEEVGNTTHILEHKVLVTHIQIEEQPKDVFDDDGELTQTTALAPTGNLLVTVALDPSSLERVVFTLEFGSVWLAAEPHDAPEGGAGLVTRANVFDESLGDAGVQ